jgi:hypothetical protein
MTPHTPHCIFAAPRTPQHASRVHVAHAVTTRISLYPRMVDGGCNMLVHRGSAKHCLPVLEPQRIPLEHTRRPLLILGRVISMEESILEPLRFGAPFCNLQWRTHPRALLSTPFNARCDGFVRIGHGSPPLLDPSNAEVRCVCLVARSCGRHRGPSLPRFKNTLLKAHRRCQGINTSCPVPGSRYVSSSCRALKARYRDENQILENAGVAEPAGLSIQPRQHSCAEEMPQPPRHSVVKGEQNR